MEVRDNAGPCGPLYRLLPLHSRMRFPECKSEWDRNAPCSQRANILVASGV